MYQKMRNYFETGSEVNPKRPKMIFLGLNLYPNGIPSFINPDIMYLYKALQSLDIEGRIHDPHIRGSEALSQGVWLGRKTGEDNWSHTFDVMILSCPHLFYIQNMGKLANLLKPHKRGLIIDLYGAFIKLAQVGDRVDIITLWQEVEEAELLGGLPPVKRIIMNPGKQTGECD
jgi:UDP-N-acetyl-D-mannosaminuronate dehydrogenase